METLSTIVSAGSECSRSKMFLCILDRRIYFKFPANYCILLVLKLYYERLFISFAVFGLNIVTQIAILMEFRFHIFFVFHLVNISFFLFCQRFMTIFSND